MKYIYHIINITKPTLNIPPIDCNKQFTISFIFGLFEINFNGLSILSILIIFIKLKFELGKLISIKENKTIIKSN